MRPSCWYVYISCGSYEVLGMKRGGGEEGIYFDLMLCAQSVKHAEMGPSLRHSSSHSNHVKSLSLGGDRRRLRQVEELSLPRGVEV